MCKKLQSPKGKGQRGQSFSCIVGQNRTRTQKRIINVRSFSPEQRHGGRKPSHSVYAKHKLLGRCSRICHQRPQLGNRRAALCWGVSRAGGHKKSPQTGMEGHGPGRHPQAGVPPGPPNRCCPGISCGQWDHPDRKSVV